MEARGDEQLLSHDSRGWVGRVERVRHFAKEHGKGVNEQQWTERIEHRVPCGCGCRVSAEETAAA